MSPSLMGTEDDKRFIKATENEEPNQSIMNLGAKFGKSTNI